ncbi:uncharacterized protein LOC111262470 isoform X2 [Varroa jacobsoni]|uniref:uncharacterized protein LOC111262470 isoform X2 n=1 Tax=Varroa jacobsoni TaxID=62625 RepID=UPI000BF62635|nr:uncharacterized protein LOC111262470 isoform X2 [Varroa jacobsoni]
MPKIGKLRADRMKKKRDNVGCSRHRFKRSGNAKVRGAGTPTSQDNATAATFQRPGKLFRNTTRHTPQAVVPTRSILPTFRPSPERLLIEYLPDPGLFIPHRRPPLVIPDPVVEQILQYLTYQDLLNLEQVHSAIQSEARSNWAWRPHCIDFNVTTLPHYISPNRRDAWRQAFEYEILRPAQNWVRNRASSRKVIEAHPYAFLETLTLAGNRAISTGDDGSITFWDSDTGESISHFDMDVNDDGNYCQLIHVFGRRVLTGSRSGEIMEWDLNTGMPVNRIPSPVAGNIRSFAIYKNWAAYLDEVGDLHLCDLTNEGRGQRLWVGLDAVNVLLNSRSVVVHRANGWVLGVSLQDYAITQFVGAYQTRPLEVLLDDIYLVLADQNQMRVWNAQTGAIIRVYVLFQFPFITDRGGHQTFLHHMYKGWVAVSNSDMLWLFDLGNDRLVLRVARGASTVQSARVGDLFLVVGDKMGYVRLYNRDTGAFLCNLCSPPEPECVYKIRIDNKRLLVGGLRNGVSTLMMKIRSSIVPLFTSMHMTFL